jgi:predicted nucleic acid-binding protein
MGALIDSSVLIDAERGKLDLARLAAQHGRETFSISALTASELLHGVYRASTRRNEPNGRLSLKAYLPECRLCLSI